MAVVEEGIGVELSQVSLNSPNCQVHLGHLPGGGVGVLTEDGNFVDVAAMVFNELCRLDEHTAAAAAGVKKDVIFDTSRSSEKCIKIVKTAGNKAFLAVFAVLVVVQLAPLRRSRSAADAGICGPV